MRGGRVNIVIFVGVVVVVNVVLTFAALALAARLDRQREAALNEFLRKHFEKGGAS
jgi:hypothetical protein